MMGTVVAKHDSGIKIALTRLLDLRENVWLEKVDKKTILSELDAVLNNITINNDLRTKEVELMIWKLKDRESK